MRFNPIPLTAMGLFFSFLSAAQDLPRYELLLKSGVFIPEKNIVAEKLSSFNRAATRIDGKTFAIIQFEQLPSETRKQQLRDAGIELLEYIPNNAYTVLINGQLDSGFLKQVQARAVIELSANQKMKPELFKGDFPAWSVKRAGTVDVWISFPKAYSFESVNTELRNRYFEILSVEYKDYRIISLRVPVQRLGELALFPFIAYVEPVPPPDQVLNYNSKYASRANVLSRPHAFGGKNLNGQGVVIGVGDNGDVQTHIDYSGRLINRTGDIVRAHATHVTGTIAGAGIIRELYTGYAPKSTIVGQFFSGIISNAPAYVQDYGMVITNNSYGEVVNDCVFNGLYNLSATIVDQQAFDLPELQHVFSVGNDGSRLCSPYPFGFKTVLGGYQASKNPLIVGSVDYKSDVSGFSSKGPVRDGRLKPEIMSMGELVASTWTVNPFYSYNNGTSMAAPGVSGGLALLIQQYRIQHAVNPKSGLMKAILCNGSTDKGNTGPDYSYGFGRMNLLRSSLMLENSTYVNASLINGGNSNNGIVVPANTAQLKVLLYWPDPPAAVMATKTLVNDLDLEVVTPSGTVRPFILDTLPANVNIPATTGIDRMNNMEQVVINNPAAGNYSLNVLATSIAVNPTQEFFLVYDIIPESLELTNPRGGEGFVPTVNAFDTIYVQWDSWGDPANPFTLEFMSDVVGSNWSVQVPASSRIFSWVVPNIATALGQFRISKNGTALTQTSFPFTITAMPIDSLTPVQCEGYIQLGWRSVPGATDYEVMMLRGDSLVSVATTTSLNYTFSGLSKDTVYWVTMRARINGKPGFRAWAVSRQPNDGTCAGNISDNDLKIESILSPALSGRVFTNSALTNSVPITIRIKNLDNVVSTDDIEVRYTINGGAPVIETITAFTTPTSTINAQGTLDYTFATNANLLAVNTYSIVVTATKLSDPVTANNSLTKVFKQLANAPITIADLPWLDDLESAGVESSTVSQMGLSGRDRYDFVNSSSIGRIRTFVNSGMAFSGNKAINLDATIANAGTTDSLTGTFNLATFNVLADDLRLDFRFKNHGQEPNAANFVWIRGNEMDPWIKVYDLVANQNLPGEPYKLSSSIELSDSLDAHGQIFTPSFQVRWGQWGEFMTADAEGWAGYSFDDIRIYRVVDDIEMVSIDSPDSIDCGLGNGTPVTVTIRNRSNSTINSIPVFLRVDGVTSAMETAGPIPGSSTISYTFNPAVANIAAPGLHTIEAWTEYGTDTFGENDTAKLVLNNLPLINTFPHLQNFESGSGFWYTDIRESSWEYGTPVSPRINRAASGTKAWKTNRAGYYMDKELSYLYSPCYNLTGMTNPTLSFSVSLDIEDCGGTLCDAAWMEYSTDGGIVWLRLGAVGQGTNWYNRNYAGHQVWSQENYIRWHVATTALPTSNNSSLRLRFVFNSDVGLTKDGIAIDDIHIYDNLYGIYNVTGTSPVVNQPIVNGTGWIDFRETGTNKLIASINPLGTDLGSTDVQSYINTGPVRINSDQYYHDRNITIKPTTFFLPDSAAVRFYFLDSETETLINATGCGYCYKPPSAYDLGVTKYSDPIDANENGTLADNMSPNYWFINAAKAVKVPFDKGYYAEFKVKDFSEFWLNNGGFNNNTPLPVELISFTAKKKINDDVLAEWKTASESNVNHYEIELARGNADYLANRFVKIGEVNSYGNSTTVQEYYFTDTEAGKTGVRYYRLKIIDNDGRSKYSAIRPVAFNSEIVWQVYPNPSGGIFNLDYQVNDGELLHVRVYDLNGKTVKQFDKKGDGFMQRVTIDLSSAGYAKGLYLLEAFNEGKKQVFRLIKQ